MVMFCTMFISINATCSAGILNNGLGGIYIDVNAHPYTTFQTYSYGQYAYTDVGCAWFASARANQLTGIGNVIRSGVNWYNNGASVFGTSRGSTPKAPAIICWGNHVAILEKIVGNTAYISEGGAHASNSAHGYTIISSCNVNSISSRNPDFYGYVYLPGAGSSVSMVNPEITFAKDTYLVGETISASWKASSPQSNISHYWLSIVEPDGVNSVNKRMDLQTSYSHKATKEGKYIFQVWATPIGSQNGGNSLICSSTIMVYGDSAKPSTPKVSLKATNANEPVTFSWNKCLNAVSYDVYILKDNKTYHEKKGLTTTSYKVTLPAGKYVCYIRAHGNIGNYYTDSPHMILNLTSKPVLKDDGYYYCDSLPQGINSNDYYIEYKDKYVKDSYDPVAGYTKGEFIRDEYINDGAPYQSINDLGTSNTRSLVDAYYFHFCGPNAGVDCNHSQVGNYVHYDQVDDSLVNVSGTFNDSENASIKYHTLTWKSNGGSVYCNSNTTCDGAYGSHGNRCKYWYCMRTYQNKIVKKVYRYTKETNWQKTHDSNATSYQVRYKLKNPYIDVDNNAWYSQVVQEITDLGFMSGDGNVNTFKPDKSISRGMVATVLYRMSGSPTVKYSNKFSDVKDKLWYTNGIIWASDKKVVSGYTNGKFGPDDNITRQDLAIMLRNYAKFKGIKTDSKQSLTSFNDYKNVDEYAKSAVAWCVENKIISGSTKDGKLYLNPKNQATRAECAKMFTLLYKIVNK